MLAVKGPSHIVRATVGGLAHQARVPVEACRKAIEKLSNPDPDGLDQQYEGRRIKAVEHGWLVLNGQAYKDRRDSSDRKQYQADWVRAKRIKKKLSTPSVDASTHVDTVYPSDQIRSDKIRESHEELVLETQTAKLEKQSFRRSSEREPKNWEIFLEYCTQKGCSRDEAFYFFTTWKAAGWTTNGKPMADWRSKVQSWHSRNYYEQSNNGHKNQ